jgi:Sec-independent protein secretion pathway component TatC
MKEVLNFVVWQWNQWKTWQKCYIIGAFMLGAGVMAPSPYDKILFAVPMIMLFVWTGKWWVWDQLMESWNKYKTEKRELFTNIKDSHK